MSDYILLTNDEVLEHHGILGQKWGVRRFQNKDGSLTTAGRERRGYSSDKKDSNKDTKNKGPMAALLAFDVAAMVLPIAAITIADNIEKGMAYAREKKFTEERSNAPIDDKTGFKKKTREMTEKEDLERVNPGYKNMQEDTKNNCMLCTTAYDLRRRGYDVVAGKAEHGFVDSEVQKWYPKSKLEKLDKYELTEKDKKDEYKSSWTPEGYCKYVINELKSQGDSRGNLMVKWKGTFGGGHSIIYEVKDGNLKIMDGQSNKVYNNESSIYSNLLNHTSLNSVTYTRLDNTEPDYEYLLKKGLIVS